MIVIVDYGMGNLRAVLHKISKISPDVKLLSKQEEIDKAEKLILPGVGSFAAGMRNLREYGLITVLNKKVLDEKTPILGICLGMQLFTKHSEEGDADGLGWVDAETKRFRLDARGFKVPHVGWNTLKIKKESSLFAGISSDHRFYFTHSYHVCCEDEEDVLASTEYGCEFTSAIQRDNIIGVQFHPEKSHQDGIKVIKNFIEKM
jgi:glutamine amidotransferase